MTNNEKIECPVCGEILELDMESSEELGLVLLLCRTEDCSISRITPKYAQSGAALVQSRIDAAVQEERERVISIIESWGEQVEDLINVRYLIQEINNGN